MYFLSVFTKINLSGFGVTEYSNVIQEESFFYFGPILATLQFLPLMAKAPTEYLNIFAVLTTFTARGLLPVVR